MDFKSKQNPGKFKALSKYISHPDIFLIVILVGNNLVAVTFATIATLKLDEELNPELSWLLITIVLLFVGEIIPKTIFRSVSNRILPSIIPFIRLFHLLFMPIIKFVQFIINSIFKLFRVSSDEAEKIFTRDELENLLLHITKEKYARPEKQKIIKKTLELEQANVRSIMVPRKDIVAVSIDQSTEQIQNRFVETGVSRLFVYQKNLDEILGYVHFHDFISPVEKWDEKIISLLFFPETKKLREALAEFKMRNEKIAVVIDEHGGIEGIITIEDIIEKIIGEIQDEFDFEEENITQIKDRVFLVNAHTSLEELEDNLNLIIPKSEDYQTISGFLLKKIGRIPKVGFEYILDSKWKIIVVEVMRTGIKLVRIQIIDEKINPKKSGTDSPH